MKLELISHDNDHADDDQINLIEAQHSFAIVELQFQDSSERFQSAILAVDPHAHIILIDEVFPRQFPANRQVAVNVTLKLARGRRKSFLTRIVNTLNGPDGAVRYQLAMPAHLTYRQRRESYRFRLRGAGDFAEFYTPDHFYCSGTIADISLTGLRMQLEQDARVDVHDVLNSFAFNFCHEQFRCNASVQNFAWSADGRQTIGVALHDMPRPQERLLEKTIMQLHRKMAKQTVETRFEAA